MISIRAVSKLILILGTVAFALNVYSSGGYGNIKNGFNLSNSIIPVGDIKRGGPARDGIPSIDSPEFISAAVALKKYGNDDRAIVVSHDGIKKVYPIAIMNWHELVNDQIAGTPILVTFCPLCGTGIVFKAAFSGNRLIFGVSGLLYQSDVLMFDRQTNSLWSQLLNKSVSGKNVGKSLDVFPSSHLLLKDYLLKNPKALVLSQKTGKKRDYKRDPYQGYQKSKKLYFPIKNSDSSVHPKKWSLLLKYGTQAKILVLDRLPKKNQRHVVKFVKKSIDVAIDHKGKSFVCPKVRGLSCMTGFYFALKTFYPTAIVE